MTTRNPFVGSGRLKEAGDLATRKQDFNAHVQGTGFRQDATTIDMNPAISGVPGATVQAALTSLHSQVSSSGTGYISIGSQDGYAQGAYNVGSPGTPTLFDAFNAAFADHRLVNGGLILLLAGTYILKNTVTIPEGISLSGEIGGTLIIGEMPETSMFIIKSGTKDTRIGGDSGSGTVHVAVGSDISQTRFFNLILSDNLNGTAAFGQASMQTVPMISCKVSSNAAFYNVTFLGKLNSGVVLARHKTLAAIGYVAGGGTGSYLSMTECFIDGTKTGINFTPNNGNIDSLVIERCKARVWGTEDPGSTTAPLNAFVVATLCNATLSDNFVIGGGSQVNTFLALTTGVGLVKINIKGNSGTPASLPGVLIANGTGVTIDPAVICNNWGNVKGSVDYSTGLLDSNNIDFTQILSNSSNRIEVSSLLEIGDGIAYDNRDVSGTCTMDELEFKDSVLLVDTIANAPAIINLVSAFPGRTIVIRDTTGGASTNPIQVKPLVGKQIDGVVTLPRLLSADYGTWTFYCLGGDNWVTL